MTNPRPDVDISTREYAEHLDEQDPLKHFRNEFLVPSKADLKSKTLGNLHLLLPRSIDTN